MNNAFLEWADAANVAWAALVRYDTLRIATTVLDERWQRESQDMWHTDELRKQALAAHAEKEHALRAWKYAHDHTNNLMDALPLKQNEGTP